MIASYTIENKVIHCSHCKETIDLSVLKDLYKSCKCFNIRLIKCKSSIHFTSFKDNEELFI